MKKLEAQIAALDLPITLAVSCDNVGSYNSYVKIMHSHQPTQRLIAVIRVI